MGEPGWNFCGICRDRDLAPEHLKIDVSADRLSKVAPDDCVRIRPNVKLKRPFPHRGELGAAIAAHKLAHFF